MQQLAGKRVTVMGLGRFGGGAGVTRWLAQQGADLLVTDLDAADALQASLAGIDDLVRAGVVRLRLGEHNVSDFTDTDIVVANPAVPKPWDNRYLRAARAAGVVVTTEMRLLVERLPDRRRVIAITGSVGKSTTSAMIAHALRHAGRDVVFGGNIGGSLLPELQTIRPTTDVVLEVSSAMLHWLSAGAGFDSAAGWSPGIAVATNIAPNHLDWHGEFAHYERSKRQILRDQRPGDAGVLHQSIEAWRSDTPARVIVVRDAASDFAGGPGDMPTLVLPGRHNRVNAAVAAEACAAAGLDQAASLRAIAGFAGLPHRLELVGVFERGARGAVRAYNDSKSTTPESCRLAVQAMEEHPEIGASRTRLICGGYDKKIDLAPLAFAATRCAAVYTIGATGASIAQQINAKGGRATCCERLEPAVEAALAEVRPGETILLSPGCASWDQFTNYEERGALFARLIRQGLGAAEPSGNPGATIKAP